MPLEFYLWGQKKELVYKNTIETEDKQYIQNAFTIIYNTVGIYERVRNYSVLKNYWQIDIANIPMHSFGKSRDEKTSLNEIYNCFVIRLLQSHLPKFHYSEYWEG